MQAFKQIDAVTRLSLSSLPQRLGASSVIVIGIASVVAVLISVLSMSMGFQHTLAATGSPERAIVLRGGSESEFASSIERVNTLTILDAPGVLRGADGKPIGSAEAAMIVDLPKKSDDSNANVTIRGVGEKAFELRPEIHLVEGRMFRRGLRELIVGRGAQHQFKGLNVGAHLSLRDTDWTVVGSFESDGDAHESELLADVETLLPAYRRTLYQSVVVRLESAASLDAFTKAVTSNPQLSVDAKSERNYYAQQSERLSKVLNFVAYVVGGIMAIGAMFGALNTMYSAVSTRSQEIAILRAIGFGSTPVVISVMIEALLLALIGALIGSALAWGIFNGHMVSALGASFSQVVFRLTVTPALVVLGVSCACFIGIVGGLLPAIRAARKPVAAALRAA